ncbi:hypothetical protein ACIOWG_02445 [Streptomyces sp. NPDC087658]|uniref:hypothetical protein n=1 Tax=Streptomyces sp. NPDC087658 TaxID=3365800 RepID=UPI00380C9DD3
MICPHCDKRLLRRERPDLTCSTCERRFALDPKTNDLGISDVGIRRLTEKLTDGGRLKITVEQLCFAATRRNRTAGRGRDGAIGCSLIGLPISGALLAVGAHEGGNGLVFAVFGAVLLIGVVVQLIAKLVGTRREEKLPIGYFRSTVLARWRELYGALPPGVVDRTAHHDAALLAGTKAALFCQDSSVLVFLEINKIPQKYEIVLVTEARAIPEAVPVIVLHDADPAGCLLTERIRETLPGRRVIDAGLPPRSVMSGKGTASLRGPRPEPATLYDLRATGALTAAELAWLAKGWTGALAGVPPVKLLAAVVRVVERATAAVDTDRRGAEALGFLSWPGEEAAR